MTSAETQADAFFITQQELLRRPAETSTSY